MIESFRPLFWCMCLTGIFWSAAGITVGSPVAFTMGGLSIVLPIALVHWGRSNLHFGAEKKGFEIVGLSALVPQGKGVDLILNISLMDLCGLQLDIDGASTRVEVIPGDPGAPGCQVHLTSEGLGEVRLHGLWVSGVSRYGFTRERHYLPIGRSWVWGVYPFEADDRTAGVYTNQEDEQYGNLRKWSYGDQGSRIDKRASLRTGYPMVRDTSSQPIPPGRIIVGPLGAVLELEPKAASRLLSRMTVACYSLHPGSLVEVVILGLERPKVLYRPSNPSELYEELQANALPLCSVDSEPNDMDPHFIQEHLLATHRMSTVESTLPGAWLGKLEAGTPDSVNNGILGYWRQYGPVAGRKHNSNCTEQLAEMSGSYWNAEHAHWLMPAGKMAEELAELAPEPWGLHTILVVEV